MLVIQKHLYLLSSFPLRQMSTVLNKRSTVYQNGIQGVVYRYLHMELITDGLVPKLTLEICLNSSKHRRIII